MSNTVQEYDNLYNTGIDHSPNGFPRYMPISEEENNMRKLCEIMKNFEKSNDVYDRLGHLFEFSVVEVVDTAFHLLKKFPNNPYFQVRCVYLIRYVICDNDVYVPHENIQNYINIVVEAIRIVNVSITNTQEILSDFTEDCISILYKLGAKNKENGIVLDNLTKMYNNYVKFDSELDKIYKELF